MLMAASWDPCYVAACVESRGAGREAWPKTTSWGGAERPSTVLGTVPGTPKYGTGKSTSCEELKIPDRTVHLEERIRIIMGTDPGPGNGTDRYLRATLKHESVACVGRLSRLAGFNW